MSGGNCYICCESSELIQQEGILISDIGGSSTITRCWGWNEYIPVSNEVSKVIDNSEIEIEVPLSIRNQPLLNCTIKQSYLITGCCKLDGRTLPLEKQVK